MSFCSPTTGTGRPRTSASNSASCFSRPTIATFPPGGDDNTEETPKMQDRPELPSRKRRSPSRTPLLDIHSDIHAPIRSRPCKEIGVVRIARHAEDVHGRDATEEQRRLCLGHAVHFRDEVDV